MNLYWSMRLIKMRTDIQVGVYFRFSDVHFEGGHGHCVIVVQVSPFLMVKFLTGKWIKAKAITCLENNLLPLRE